MALRNPLKKAATRLRPRAESGRAAEASRDLWRGLIRFNRKAAGPLKYKRVVLTLRGKSGKVLGGLILQSYWKESFVELLWLSDEVRRQGHGRALIEEAERRARRRGSRMLHLNTYSFQAPGFYEKLGFRRFGTVAGSPRGARRHYYVKILR